LTEIALLSPVPGRTYNAPKLAYVTAVGAHVCGVSAFLFNGELGLWQRFAPRHHPMLPPAKVANSVSEKPTTRGMSRRATLVVVALAQIIAPTILVTCSDFRPRAPVVGVRWSLGALSRVPGGCRNCRALGVILAKWSTRLLPRLRKTPHGPRRARNLRCIGSRESSGE
jgi:hypothetical protein